MYLSICGGSLYLTQIGGTQTKILLFELVSFSGTETSIKMTAVTTYVSNRVTQTANQYTIPYVVDVGGTKMMALLVRYKEPPQIERYTGLAPDRASAPVTVMVFAAPVAGMQTSRWASTR